MSSRIFVALLDHEDELRMMFASDSLVTVKSFCEMDLTIRQPFSEERLDWYTAFEGDEEFSLAEFYNGLYVIQAVPCLIEPNLTTG